MNKIFFNTIKVVMFLNTGVSAALGTWLSLEGNISEGVFMLAICALSVVTGGFAAHAQAEYFRETR